MFKKVENLIKTEYSNLSKSRLNTLMDFHAQNKYLYFCYDQNIKDEMGKLLGSKDKKDIEIIYKQYGALLENLFNQTPNKGKLVNSLTHMYGYFKDSLNQDEKNALIYSIDNVDFDNSLIAVLNHIYFLSKKFNKKYIYNQSIFYLIDKNDKLNTLKTIAGDLPSKPGIYMFYSNDKIVYIGKSKSLRSRVLSYFRNKHEREKIYQMMQNVDDIKVEICKTHLEARILEYYRIQEYQPIYNAQYKREKKSKYIILDEQHLIRESVQGDFGPFISKRFIKNFSEDMKKIYPIYIDGQEIKYDFKIFSNRLNKNERRSTYESLFLILTNIEFTDKFISSLNSRMLEASSQLAFERANYYKMLISHVEYIKETLVDKKDFLNTTFIYKEDSHLTLIHKGEIASIEPEQDIKTFIQKSKTLLKNYIPKSYNEEVKSMVYSHIKNDGFDRIVVD